jgi:hypothetical protein
MDFNMNMDFNMDFNMGTPGSSVGGNATRVRFNTEDYRKYLAPGAVLVPVNPNLMRFPAYWDPELRACEYVNGFLLWFFDWRARLQAAVPANVPNLNSPHLFAPAALTNQIVDMLDRAPDRPDRFNEIRSQHSGEGAIGYFLGMLMIDPGRMPATHLLIRVARRLGEHIAMCLKGEFRCPRPSQLCSAIVPMIDPPATPSFPSGHSLQAALIARCLSSLAPPMQPPILIEELAERVGENRIIAGLHYLQDHVIGLAIGRWIYNQLLGPLLVGPLVNHPLNALAPGPPPLVSFQVQFRSLIAAATIEMANQWAPAP